MEPLGVVELLPGCSPSAQLTCLSEILLAPLLRNSFEFSSRLALLPWLEMLEVLRVGGKGLLAWLLLRLSMVPRGAPIPTPILAPRALLNSGYSPSGMNEPPVKENGLCKECLESEELFSRPLLRAPLPLKLLLYLLASSKGAGSGTA
jgi:hypothetical protein